MSIIKKASIFLLLLTLIGQARISEAQYVVTLGQTYPIAEPDLISVLQAELQTKLQQGVWQHWQAEAQQQADRPTPVSGLSPTIHIRSWYWNPSVVLAGKSIDPLTSIHWKAVWVFYDGDDPKQVAWATAMDQQYQQGITLILVKGSISDQKRRFKRAIYFDQGGRLTTRLHIQHIPAIVMQQGSALQITEVVP